MTGSVLDEIIAGVREDVEARQREGPLDAWVEEVARTVGMTTPPVSLSTACSSGADAILVGAEAEGLGKTADGPGAIRAEVGA